jgi:hypothetical protein
MRHPKGQLKEAQSGEGVRSNFGTGSSKSGSADSNQSMGKDYQVDARHTAAWMNGAKLTVKRSG